MCSGERLHRQGHPKENPPLISVCTMCVNHVLHCLCTPTFLLRFFSMLSTAKTCSPAAGSSIFGSKRREAARLGLFFLFFFSPPPPRCAVGISDTFSSLPGRVLFLCSSDVRHKSPPLLLFVPCAPPRRHPLCSRVRAAATKHFMQIAVDVTSREGGGDRGRRVVPVLTSGAVGKKMEFFQLDVENYTLKCKKKTGLWKPWQPLMDFVTVGYFIVWPFYVDDMQPFAIFFVRIPKEI